MASKTDIQISQDITTNLQALRTDIDVSSGTVTKDVIVDQPATAIGLAYTELDNIKHGHSISYVSSLSDVQVEELADNWGLARKEPTQSQGYVTFFRRTAPPSTITISSGTTISTQKDSNNITHSFTTLSTGTITSGSYNSVTRLWETTVATESVAYGTTENVAANTITVVNGVSGVDGCTNRLAFTSGTDKETNAQLAIRITTAAQARLLGTAPGYQNLVNEITGVESSKVVTAGSSDSLRNENGSECDIVVMGEDITSTTQVEIFNSSDGLCVFFDSLPVIEIGSIVGASRSFVEGTDFQFVQDTNSEYYNSSQSLDKFVWLNGGQKPSDNESYTVSYSYNKLIGDIQTEIDLEANTLLASDVLVRSATPVIVDISMSVAITSGIDSTEAINQIETAIAAFVATLSMGDELQQSDIDYYIRDTVPAVDKIILPFTKICRRSVGSGTTDLTCTKFEYFTLDDNSLNVIVI